MPANETCQICAKDRTYKFSTLDGLWLCYACWTGADRHTPSPATPPTPAKEPDDAR